MGQEKEITGVRLKGTMTLEEALTEMERNTFEFTEERRNHFINLWNIFQKNRAKGIYTEGHIFHNASDKDFVLTLCIEFNDLFVNISRMEASSDRKIWRMFHEKGHLTDKELKKKINQINYRLKKKTEIPDRFDNELIKIANIGN